MTTRQSITGTAPFSGPRKSAPAWVKSLKKITKWCPEHPSSRDHLIVIPRGHSYTPETVVSFGNCAWNRLLLYAEKNVQASIFVSLDSNGTGQEAYEFDCILETGAHIALVFVKGKNGNPLIHQTLTIGKDARLALTNITLGSCTHTLQADASGEHAETHIDWIVHTRHSMSCDLSACTNFRKKHGRGTMIIRGVAEGSSSLKSRGSIVIGKNAEGTEARLDQKILILDAMSTVDAIPKLTIETNDVHVSHATTVSRIHDDDLFYCASRGINPSAARTLLTEGFLGQSLLGFLSRPLRDAAERALI